MQMVPDGGFPIRWQRSTVEAVKGTQTMNNERPKLNPTDALALLRDLHAALAAKHDGGSFYLDVSDDPDIEDCRHVSWPELTDLMQRIESVL
jgi:hypothetical protein